MKLEDEYDFILFSSHYTSPAKETVLLFSESAEQLGNYAIIML